MSEELTEEQKKAQEEQDKTDLETLQTEETPEEKAAREEREKQTQAPTFSKPSEAESEQKIKHLTDLIHLHGAKLETLFQNQTRTHEESREINKLLQETTNLLHGLIAEMDEHREHLLTATAGLIQLHEQQSKKQQTN